MDYEAILEETRSLLDEDQPSFWEDDELERWINQGYKDIAARLECIRSTSNLSLVIGTDSYTMPTGVVDKGNTIRKILIDNLEVDQISLSDLDGIASATTGGFGETGTPDYFILWGDVIKFYPIPDAIKTAVIYYVDTAPSDLGETDTPDLPEYAHQLISLFAASKAKRKDEETTQAEALIQQYLQGIVAAQAQLRGHNFAIDALDAGYPEGR
jgi:hypothetical protein